MIYRLPEDFIHGSRDWGQWERPDGFPADANSSNDLCRRVVEIAFHAIAASHGKEGTLDLDTGEIKIDAAEEDAMRWFDTAMESVWTALDDGMILAFPLLKPGTQQSL